MSDKKYAILATILAPILATILATILAPILATILCNYSLYTINLASIFRVYFFVIDRKNKLMNEVTNRPIKI